MKRMTWITLTGAFLIAGFTLSACNQKEAPNDAAAKLQSLEARLNASEARNNDIALATRCSEAAANFYKRNVETDKSPPGFSSSYKNHWNKKMQKCFVQIDSSSPNDNRLFTDLYDVFENKRYACSLDT